MIVATIVVAGREIVQAFVLLVEPIIQAATRPQIASWTQAAASWTQAASWASRLTTA